MSGSSNPPPRVDYRLDRLDSQDLREQVDRTKRVHEQQPEALLVRTAVKDTYPTTASAWYWCQVMALPAGNPVEGESATLVAGSRHVWCYNVGPGIPDEGTDIIATNRRGRYVINFA